VARRAEGAGRRRRRAPSARRGAPSRSPLAGEEMRQLGTTGRGRGLTSAGSPATPPPRRNNCEKEPPSMALRGAINGFGRIGRPVWRWTAEHARRDIEVVAINDLGPVETNAHLLRHDSVHGHFPGIVTVEGDAIDVGLGKIKVTAIRNPAELPHKELGV